MLTKEQEQYLEFMTSPENIENCQNCPENRDSDSWGGNKPCGQQNCWVECHCQHKQED